MKQALKIFLIIIINLCLFVGNPILAEEEQNNKENEALVTLETEKKHYEEDPIARIFIYLGILCAVAMFIVWFFKKGKFAQVIGKKQGLLQIKETRVLGNKQYLVVIEYGEQKILVGVGPGVINKICDLEYSCEKVTPKIDNFDEDKTPISIV